MTDLSATTAYRGHESPVRVTGRLDPPLSRWLWAVKWILLIPHVIVLFFLWIAFLAVTIFAFFAITLLIGLGVVAWLASLALRKR